LRVHQNPKDEKNSSEFFEFPRGSSENRRSAYASLLLIEVLTNLSDLGVEKNSSEFFELIEVRLSASLLIVEVLTNLSDVSIVILFLWYYFNLNGGYWDFMPR
jgi:hypothetical protein